MRKVFLDKLPKWENGGARKGKIDWGKSIGYTISFIFDDIQGELKIIDYKLKQHKVLISYKGKLTWIQTNGLYKCLIQTCLGLLTKEYTYEIGYIVETKNSKLKILKQIRMNNGKNKTQKGYEYLCLNCGNIDTITECHLIRKNGCNVCCTPSRKILKGYNDMWTVNPNLAKLLVNPKDAYKYSQWSSKKVDWKCPVCGTIIKNKRISDINKCGLSCPKCGDGISYPEKFMFSILEQILNNKFKYQYSPKWIKPKRYDFYFEINNKKYIIEMDGGLGHGNIDNKMNGQTKEKSKAIDKYKDEQAKLHNIEIIRIDCNYINSSIRFDFIKNNILNSKLNKIFNLSKIDWLECKKYLYKSFLKIACEYWNQGIHNLNQISKVMKIGRNAIVEYLKTGALLNFCNYDPKKAHSENGKIYIKLGTKAISKPVEVFKNNISLGIFKSMADLSKQSKELFGVHLDNTTISLFCRGKYSNNTYKGFVIKFVNKKDVI